VLYVVVLGRAAAADGVTGLLGEPRRERPRAGLAAAQA
jgi:hypothetical protein